MPGGLIPYSANGEGVTDEQVMRVDLIHVLHRRLVHLQLYQHHWREESEDYRGGRRGGQALVARQLLALVMQIEPALALDQGIDEQSDHCEHGSCGNPLGFLQPHRRNGSRVLEPAKPWLHRAMLVMIGL